MFKKVVKTYQIGSTADLAALVPSMNRAEERNIHIDGVNDPNPASEDYWSNEAKAIVNSNSNTRAQIVTPGYQILQHSDFFGGLCDLLQDDAREVYGIAHETDNGNRWKVRVIFNDVDAVSETGHGKNVKIGAEFTNSYNGQNSASGNGYYMRVSCTNQFTLHNLIHEISFNKNHVAPDTETMLEMALKGAEHFVNGVGNMAAPLDRIIHNAQGKLVAFEKDEDAVETFSKMFGAKVIGRGIVERLLGELPADHEGAFEVSRWDIYNAATDLASHGDKISLDTMDKILGIAERKVLDIRSEIPMYLAPVAVAAVA
jgi:hypothetical protein